MILLDAYAVLAHLTGEPHAGPLVGPLMRNGALSVVNGAEVLDHLVRVRGAAETEAALDLAQLDLAMVEVSETIARRAGLLRARRYHRANCAVSLADCIAAATALADPDVESLATSDPHLLDLIHAEGGRVHPLPDTQGVLWTPQPAPEST